MQQIQGNKGAFSDEIITQVAEISSFIHNCDIKLDQEMDTDYPPFSTWYDLFLEKEIVTERIGRVLQNRVKKMI